MKLKKTIIGAFKGSSILLLVLPSSSNYMLQSSSFGSGGGVSSSTNYKENGQSGQTAGNKASGVNYLSGAGLTFSEQADVPPAPAFANSANYYNRLLVTVNQGPNASDAKYAIAISGDGFVTKQYLRADGTLGASLTSSNYQTYLLWGGASGTLVLGLNPHTTYLAKVSAMHGVYTASGFGPTGSATTNDPSLAFALATTLQPTPPYSINFGSLPVNAVVSSSQNVLTTLTTNAQQGGNIYLVGQNAGLTSALANYTIASATANLAVALEGFGARSLSATQSSGGPFAAVSPYTGSGSFVGAVSKTPTPIYTSSAPLNAGSSAFVLQAKSASSDPAASDYAEVITITAAANF